MIFVVEGEIVSGVQGLAERYRKQCLYVGRGHYLVHESLQRRDGILGSALVLLTAIAATSLFSDLGGRADGATRLVAGTISGLASVLAAFSTFLRLAERAAGHKAAGAQYGLVRRELEGLILADSAAGSGAGEASQRLAEIAARMGELAERSPHLAKRYYLKAVREQKAVDADSGD